MSSSVSADRSSESSFGYVNGTFINVYSRDNPLKEEGEQCYFLFNAADNYHIMVIGRGTIVRDWFTDGLNKVYCIKLDEVCENNFVLEKFVWDREYFMVGNADVLRNRPAKLTTITKKTSAAFLALNLFKIEGFFVRDTLVEIVKLRKEYSEVILQDTKKSIEDLEYILADNR
jgi:hypothetical protein